LGDAGGVDDADDTDDAADAADADDADDADDAAVVRGVFSSIHSKIPGLQRRHVTSIGTHTSRTILPQGHA
jgi:hypothetical protein